MTPLDWGLWAVVAGLALLAGWLSLPKPPELNWRDFFALGVVTPIRGELDAQGAQFEDWVARTEPLLGRGELDVIYEDPADFGTGYDLTPTLGMGADWESVASDAALVRERLLERDSALHWVVRGGEAVGALEGLVTHFHRMDGPREALMDELGELLSDLSRRVVFVGEGAAAQEWTELLHAEAGLRDRTLALVGIEAELKAAWLEEHFSHEAMDTELERHTAFFHLAFEGVEERGWPQPPVPDSLRTSVVAEELGPLLVPRGAEPDLLWAQALVLTIAHWIAIES